MIHHSQPPLNLLESYRSLQAAEHLKTKCDRFAELFYEMRHMNADSYRLKDFAYQRRVIRKIESALCHLIKPVFMNAQKLLDCFHSYINLTRQLILLDNHLVKHENLLLCRLDTYDPLNDEIELPYYLSRVEKHSRQWHQHYKKLLSLASRNKLSKSHLSHLKSNPNPYYQAVIVIDSQKIVVNRLELVQKSPFFLNFFQDWKEEYPFNKPIDISSFSTQPNKKSEWIAIFENIDSEEAPDTSYYQLLLNVRLCLEISLMSEAIKYANQFNKKAGFMKLSLNPLALTFSLSPERPSCTNPDFPFLILQPFPLASPSQPSSRSGSHNMILQIASEVLPRIKIIADFSSTRETIDRVAFNELLKLHHIDTLILSSRTIIETKKGNDLFHKFPTLNLKVIYPPYTDRETEQQTFFHKNKNVLLPLVTKHQFKIFFDLNKNEILPLKILDTFKIGNAFNVKLYTSRGLFDGVRHQNVGGAALCSRFSKQVIPDLKKCKNLKTLRIAKANQIDDELFSLLLKSISRIENLDISKTQLSDKGLLAISKLKSLKKLSLKGLVLDSKSFSQILKLKNLSHLTLNVCKVSSSLLAEERPPLKTLTIKGVYEETGIIGAIRNIKTLQILKLKNNPAVSLKTLYELSWKGKKLKKLAIERCRNIQEEDLVKYLSHLPNLLKLTLSKNISPDCVKTLNGRLNFTRIEKR